MSEHYITAEEYRMLQGRLVSSYPSTDNAIASITLNMFKSPIKVQKFRVNLPKKKKKLPVLEKLSSEIQDENKGELYGRFVWQNTL